MQPDPTPRQPQQGDAYAGECGDPIWECEPAGEMREDPANDPHAPRRHPAEPRPAVPTGKIIDLVKPRPQ
jgi:hypothetical protein